MLILDPEYGVEACMLKFSGLEQCTIVFMLCQCTNSKYQLTKLRFGLNSVNSFS